MALLDGLELLLLLLELEFHLLYVDLVLFSLLLKRLELLLDLLCLVLHQLSLVSPLFIFELLQLFPELLLLFGLVLHTLLNQGHLRLLRAVALLLLELHLLCLLVSCILPHTLHLVLVGGVRFIHGLFHLLDLLLLLRILVLQVSLLLPHVLDSIVTLFDELLERLHLIDLCLELRLPLPFDLRLCLAPCTLLFLLLFSLALFFHEFVQSLLDALLDLCLLVADILPDVCSQLANQLLVLVDFEIGFGYLVSHLGRVLVLSNLEVLALLAYLLE